MPLGVPNIATAGVRIAPDFSGFGREMQRGVQTGLAGISQRALGAGQALAPLSIALAGVGIAAGKMALDFGKSMTQIETLVGISRDQIDAWEGDILSLSGEVGRAPTELADALYFVTSAGIATSEALDVVEVSAKAAALGLGETGVVADAVSSAMNAYGSEVLSAERATEILTAAVREGKIEANALAPQLGRLLPTAAALSIRFEDVAGVMAVMSRTGLDAAEASTSLSAIMSTLLKPGAAAKSTLEGVGLSMGELREIAAQPGGLIEVMRLLDEALGDDDEALVKVIPNIRAFRGVMNVLAQDGDIVDDAMAGVADSVGLVAAAFAALQKDPAFQLQQAISALQGAAISLGGVFAPAITVISGGIKIIAEGFQRLSPVSRTIVGIGIALGALSAPLLLLVGGISRTILSLQGLTTAHLRASSAARIHAASEGAVAGAVARTAGAGAAGAAGVTTRTVGGLGTFTLGAAAGRGAGGIGGALARTGPRLLRGLGIGLAADLGAGLVQGIETQEGTIGDTVKRVGSAAIRGAGLGAAVGSIVPVIGTGIGAAAGALIGGVVGLVVGKRQEVTAAAAATLDRHEAARSGQAAGQAMGDGFVASATAAVMAFRFPEGDTRNIFAPFEDQFEEIKSVGIASIAELTAHNLEHIGELDAGFRRLTEGGLLTLRDKLSTLAESDPGAALGTLREVLREIDEGDFESLIDIETNLRLGEGTLPKIDTVVEEFKGLLDERLQAVFATPGVTTLGGEFLAALFPSEAEIATGAALIGGSIPEGFRTGIDEGSGEAINAGAALIFGTIEAMRGAAEAESPAKTTIRLGLDLTRGLLLGLETGFGEVQRLVTARIAALNRQIQTGIAEIRVRGLDQPTTGGGGVRDVNFTVNNPSTQNLDRDARLILSQARLFARL